MKIAIAEAYSKLNQLEKAPELLEKALTSANEIKDSSDDKASALSAIAEAEANLKNWGQALKIVQQCPKDAIDNCKMESLARILTVHAEQQHPELKSPDVN